MSAPTPVKAPVGLRARVVDQFRHPRGLLGALAGMVLAQRRSNRERNAWTVDLLEVAPGDRVLELGFGPGLSIERASQLAHQGLVVGVDHSAAMVRMAERRNATAIRDGRVRLVEASLDGLPDFETRFDKAFAVNALQFAESPVETLRRVREHMQPGGRIVVTQQSRKQNATDADSMRAAEGVREQLERAGFTEMRIQKLPLEPVCAACVVAMA